MESTRLLWSRSICAIPWISLALVLAVAAFINHTVDVDSLRLDTGSLIPPNSDMEPGGDLPSVSRHFFVRLAWGITATGFSLVAIAAMAMALHVFWSCLRDLSSECHTRFTAPQRAVRCQPQPASQAAPSAPLRRCYSVSPESA